MKLFDEVINTWSGLLKDHSKLEFRVDTSDEWTDAGNHQMILRGDMAYELGGSTPSLYALGATAVTASSDLVPCDEIILCGPDMGDIKEDISYARLMIVRVDEEDLGDGNTLYNSIKKIDNVKYHVNPEGAMMRVSSVYARESVRVSKEALKKGLSFSHMGNLLIKELHKNPKVKAAKMVFVTDPSFDFKGLSDSCKKASDITATIDHIMKEAMTDCNSCSLKPVCDEVEGLKEMHFGRKQE